MFTKTTNTLFTIQVQTRITQNYKKQPQKLQKNYTCKQIPALQRMLGKYKKFLQT